MTAASIGAAKGGSYARYLEAKTLAPGRGDYYLLPSGEPTQAPGKWLAQPVTLAALGIESEAVRGADFVALMEGRHPRSGEWIRAAGADGQRGGGIDLTFSAPKSVSAVWALADEGSRHQLEEAHAQAIRRTLTHLVRNVPTIRRRQAGTIAEERGVDLLATEYRHTTARGVLGGDPPDPQLHSHVVITAAVRDDGRLVAVASRPVFRAARELGAYYRSALADELTNRGYAVRAGSGKDARYFEIAGVPDELLQAFSARSREVASAAERFRARWGRAPERGELRRLKLESRRAKTPVTRTDLQRHWHQVAQTHGYTNRAQLLRAGPRTRGVLGDFERRVEELLTERAATFSGSELRAVALEQSAGQLGPDTALARAERMIQHGRVLALTDNVLTTRALRARERTIERRLRKLASTLGPAPSQVTLSRAAGSVAERLGAPLTAEQRAALRTITGPSRAAVLIGPAGTGKGVVIDAAARAEQAAGTATHGVAVSGSTAQRLGRDSPALAGRTLTLDALVARADHGSVVVGEQTTIYLDEAGMADTMRLERLTTLAERRGARLVLIGDPAQLPSIGAGGMFERLAKSLPTTELTEVRRATDTAERRAWADLRSGRSRRALAHYRARGRLHLQDTRDRAVEYAVRDWARLTQALPINEVALVSDASNREIERLNARAQHHRLTRGELGDVEVQIPGVHYGLRAGDRVALVDQHRPPDLERIENGARGEVLDVSEDGELLVQFDATGRWRTFAPDDLGTLRLAYAHHAYRMQGATVTRALVITGGWQTANEAAYVQASRARDGTDFYLARDELGSHGDDIERIERLAARMRSSRAQIPSLAHPRLDSERSVLQRTPIARRRERTPERSR
jgi:conjugative relaxase-like TrwC/TraI family protein